MKRSALKKVGKKGKQWIKDRAKLIKEAVAEGRITIEHGYPEGICEDCRQWKKLEPDHIKKRSQGGKNIKNNIAWRCRKCHNKVDNMPNSKKQKGKKPNWSQEHKCKSCGYIVRTLICSNCGKISI